MLIKLKNLFSKKTKSRFSKFADMIRMNEPLPKNVLIYPTPTSNGATFGVLHEGYTFFEVFNCDEKGNVKNISCGFVSLLKYANMKRNGEKLPEDLQVYLKPLLHGGTFFVVISGAFPTEIHECNEKGNSIYQIHAFDFWNYANMKYKNEPLPKNVQVCIGSTPNGGVFSVAFKYANQTTIFECDERGNCIFIT
ncbi:MAG: hypothetical protein FWE80_00630 [Oscillospiraceae bacterium]|nr:hypothetical protein [Oscillospiraceae bacterium]